MDMTRREALAAGATTAAGLGATGSVTAVEASLPDVYTELGVTTVINAAGTITTMGGSLMPAEVTAAWQAAARRFVSLPQLQDRVGEKIAELLKVPAALVTTGAAGGIVVGTAAAITWKHPERVSQLPMPPEAGLEVIRPRSHRECYDHQATACGVKIVEVATTRELEQAIGPRTVMMLSYNVHEPEGGIGHREWLQVARRRGIITLLDAAADTPPLSRLWDYHRMGYDLVVFSGGKAIRGPQDAGLLLGRKDLINAAKPNTAPACNNIGRGMKVSKEDMVAMWAAVRRFVKLDHAAEEAKWRQRIAVIATAVERIPGVTTRIVVPPVANHVSHLLIDWDRNRLEVTPQQVKQALATGDPPILTARVHGTGNKGFLVSVFMLEPGEAAIVGRRLADVLG